MLIRDLLKHKSSNVVAVSPDHGIRQSAAIMVEQAVSALIVETEDGHFAGILTERDIARHFSVEESGRSALVSDVMTRDVITCSVEHSVSEIAEIMSDSNIRHIPVLADGRVTSIVSIRDIVRFHLSALENENRTLRELVAALN
jgi:CBS domain-containing protein